MANVAAGMADRSQSGTPSQMPKEVEYRTSWILFFLQALLAIVTAPYRRTFKLYTWRPLNEIRAADGDRQKLLSLVKDWKADKYAELQSVQVAVSLVLVASLLLCSIRVFSFNTALSRL